MAEVKNRKPKPSVEDEPGAEDRFLRSVRKALTTPPTKLSDRPKLRPKPKSTREK
jgi:hypothetical protein